MTNTSAADAKKAADKAAHNLKMAQEIVKESAVAAQAARRAEQANKKAEQIAKKTTLV